MAPQAQSIQAIKERYGVSRGFRVGGTCRPNTARGGYDKVYAVSWVVGFVSKFETQVQF